MAIHNAPISLQPEPYPETDPVIDGLVHEILGRIADRWTMLLLDVLTENGTLRFSRIADKVPGISQKMLTQTLRQMERDGLVTRTIHPVIPPHVDYALTDLGSSLSAAFCGVWLWAIKNYEAVAVARSSFDALPKTTIPKPRIP